MIGLLRAEITKMRTTPGPWIILAIQFSLTVLVGVLLFHHGTTAHGGSTGLTGIGARLTLHRLHTLLIIPVDFSLVLAPLIGVLCITGEYQHKTITPTLVANPQRSQVLLAKAGAIIVGTAVLAIVGLAVMGGVAILWTSTNSGASGLLTAYGEAMPRLIATVVLLGLFGFAFGILLKNQIAAVIATIGGTLILENVLIALVQHLLHVDLNWLPSPAAESLAGPVAHTGGTMSQLLAWWGGGLALLGWCVVPGILGYFVMFQRDIT